MTATFFLVHWWNETVVRFWQHSIQPQYWPATGVRYAFWSSIGSALTEFGAPVTLLLIYYQHSCHRSWRCLRWGHHEVEGTTGKVCHRHHTVEDHIAVRRRHPAGRLGHGDTVDISGNIVRRED